MGRNKFKKKQPKLQYDEKGQFRWETYFVGGKQKRRKRRLIDGMDPDEFIRLNADDIWLKQEGYYEILHEREMERDRLTRNGVDDGDEEDLF